VEDLTGVIKLTIWKETIPIRTWERLRTLKGATCKYCTTEVLRAVTGDLHVSLSHKE
jgi:hypothetical protein